MTTVDVDPIDSFDVELVRRAAGMLATFNRAGVLSAADVHVALRLQRLGRERDESVLLAVALVVRAVRHGSVCLDLTEAAATTAVDGLTGEDVAVLPWPPPASWLDAVHASGVVAVGEDGPADRPLRMVDGLLYLDRYWRQQRVIANYVDTAMRRPPSAPDPKRLRPALDRLFPASRPDRQRLAAVIAAHRGFSILAGGPGTGKTTTVAKLLALLQDQADGRLRIALAAPTGKAAARLQEATTDAASSLAPQDRERLGSVKASTLHRLLGSKPGARTRFWHDRNNRLPYDVVVVDEASMVSLTMMARLVDALRPGCRLILVGDPDQLASVEVGAVLGDLVERPAPDGAAPADLDGLAAGDLAELDPGERDAAVSGGVVRLSEVFRFSTEIQELAQAIRAGDPDGVFDVLDKGYACLELVEADPVDGFGMTGSRLPTLRADVVSAGTDLVTAARAGDAERALVALDRHRLLCAHREGPYGVAHWTRQVEQWLAEVVDGYGSDGPWYVGRPLLVTSNDYQLRLFNGDTGVVVDDGGVSRAAFRRDGEVVRLPTSRLSDVQTVHALSVHRSQGSQFQRVSLVLPPEDSPLLTRELLYTAVTRATSEVTVVGTEEAVRAAVSRRARRATGLAPRLARTGEASPRLPR
jgi:exodeoxyribonuclease V alpha subunit